MSDRGDHDRSVKWHVGEKAMQRSIGADVVFDGLESRIFHTQLSEQQRVFFRELRFVVVGAIHPDGRVWSGVLTGEPGFVASPEAKILRIKVRVPIVDPLDAGLQPGAAIALLGIDFARRRRFRVNGSILGRDADQLALRADQVFGNCPKYIKERRLLEMKHAPASSPERADLPSLDARARSLISTAQTFFVASYVDLDEGERQVDVSHRGGPKGFVRIEDDALMIPDYSGNRFFNTLGNFALNPVAGLVFIDFPSGELLHLSGSVEILLHSPDITSFPGAERIWRFRPYAIIRRPSVVCATWSDE